MIWYLLIIIIVATSILTIFGFVGRICWILDIFSHFRVQYAIMQAAGGLILLLGDQILAAGMAFTFMLINIAVIITLYLPSSHSDTNKKVYRLLLANVLQSNNSYGLIDALIKKESPDFIVLVEPNQNWLNQLEDALIDYPYRCSQTREDSYGIALFSCVQLEHCDIRNFGDAGVPSVVAKATLSGRSITFIGTHPPPPKGIVNSRLRNRQLIEMAKFIRSLPGAAILCGDLNMSPWSVYFRSFLRESGLLDSGKGFGVQPTWPVECPVMRVPIDHCFVSEGIRVLHRKNGPKVGSDHYPVLVDFAICES
ncbi:MAG: endonuclease/exonuclease/phosphatase family protein [Anaerolineales bacterium]